MDRSMKRGRESARLSRFEVSARWLQRIVVCRCNISSLQSRKMSPIRHDRSEGKMIGSVPQFPTIEKWQRMSENEQDALLAKMEKVRRRRATGFRIVLGLGFAAVAASILGALL
jgi:hypothetical protein